MDERRQATRFDLKLPVILRWRDGEKLREAHTISQDVSSNGIYFLLSEGIQDGTNVEVEMTLPSQITRAGPVRVRCLGRIQRCEEANGVTTGVAASINKYQFLADREVQPEKLEPV
jgi:hypothetical protein